MHILKGFILSFGLLTSSHLLAMVESEEGEKKGELAKNIISHRQQSDISQNKTSHLLSRKGKTLFEAFQCLEPFGAVRYKKIELNLKEKTILERFKTIDGPIYEKNKPFTQKLISLVKKDDFQTSTRSGNIFRSQNIPPPKDRKSNLQQGDAFDPAMALKELADLRSTYKAEEFTKMKMKEGKQGGLIAKILEKTKIEIIKDLNLGNYPLYQQKLILEFIEGLEPNSLSLRFSPLITFPYLKKLKLDGLQVLDVRGCDELSESLLYLLSTQVPALRELNFSRIKNFRRCVITRNGESYPIEFSHLELLSMSGCENLEEIHLKAPLLKRLRANRCAKLKTFNVDAPSLAFLSVLEDSKLNEEDLEECLLASIKLQDLVYEKFKGEEKELTLKAHEIDPELSVWFLYRCPQVRKQVFKQGKQLVSIDLSWNGMEAKECQLLAKGLNQNTTLKSLDLRGNGIGAGGAKNLSSLTNLTSLDLRGNNIGAEGTKGLCALTNLINLNVEGNNIGDEGANGLSSLRNLKELNVGLNNIGNVGAKNLSPLRNLTSLNMERNFIGVEGVKNLSSLTNLTSLNVHQDYIGDEGANGLSSLTNLTSLDVGHNSIKVEGVRNLASLTNLTELNVGVNDIGAEGVKNFSSLTNLTSLNVGYNNIGAEGVKNFTALTNLTSLNVSINNIGAEGVKNFSSLTNLTSLYVEDNYIGAEGAKNLSSLTNLTSLNVRNNNIGAEGVKNFSSLTNLTSLNVNINNIGAEGVKNFSSLTNLTSLNVSINNIGAEGKNALEQWKKTRPSLTIEYNNW